LHYRSERSCGVRIGHDSGIYHGTFFDLGPTGEVEIGNYVTVVGAIISTSGRVVIGDYCFISHEVMLADDFAAVPPGDTARDSNVVGRSEECIRLGSNCWIGARALLLKGAIIGENAIVGAAACVDFEVPPYAIAAGNPARIVGWTK
jgi:acetyltransferase-like isoleucine patch superfamily enzyme